ncbi:MAG TPA: redoxin domain-containing protein [Niabella sp.]|nr:redoxin domain-containing protein [Niabella sp.]
MKKNTILALALLIAGGINAQDGANSKGRIFGEIFEKGTEAQKDSLQKAIVADAKIAEKEEDLQLYYNFLNYRKQTADAEAVEKRALKLHPKGKMARSKEISKYYDLKELKDKEKQYNAILKKFPMSQFPDDGIVYDYVTAAFARELMREGKKEQSLKLLDNMQEKFWRAQGYIPIAEELLKQGDTTTALPLIQKSIEDALGFINSNDQSNKAKFAAVGYPGYVQTYAAVLLAKGKYQEALTYLEDARKIVPERAVEFAPGYARALQMTGRDLEAFNQYTSLYKTGQFGFHDALKSLYQNLNKGSLTGFDGFIDQQKTELNENIKNHLAQIITDKETPSFKLRNLKGEIVDSKSLLGKVVVLDFWATWCSPCIRSFPGMQKAVTKYEKDPDVVFLFIDTWERDDDYEKKVNEFINKNKYTFNVLFDDKKNDEEVAPRFGIKGIPAKFVIDKKGKTRFFLTGSSPYPDYILMELTQMIERAKKG